MPCDLPARAAFVVAASTIRLTQYGEPIPRIVSQLTWTAATPLRPVPKGITYEEYLCCDVAVDWGCRSTLCDPSRPDRRDPYVKERRWAPRRNHAAVTLKVCWPLTCDCNSLHVQDVAEGSVRGWVGGGRGAAATGSAPAPSTALMWCS